MPKQKEYSQDWKAKVIKKLKAKESQSSAARAFNLSRQLISVWNRRFKETGDIKNKLRKGRPRKTTKREDSIIKRISVANPTKSSTQNLY